MADAVGLAWQGSLLATGEASVDRTFANLQRHELTGGAWRDYVPGWLAGADEVFALLPPTVPWMVACWSQPETMARGSVVVADPSASTTRPSPADPAGSPSM